MRSRTQHQSNRTRRTHCRMCLGHSGMFQRPAFCRPSKKEPVNICSATLPATAQSVGWRLQPPFAVGFRPPRRVYSKMIQSSSWTLRLRPQTQAQPPLLRPGRLCCSGQLGRGLNDPSPPLQADWGNQVTLSRHIVGGHQSDSSCKVLRISEIILDKLHTATITPTQRNEKLLPPQRQLTLLQANPLPQLTFQLYFSTFGGWQTRKLNNSALTPFYRFFFFFMVI